MGDPAKHAEPISAAPRQPEPPAAGGAGSPAGGSAVTRIVAEVMSRYGVVVALALLIAGFSIALPDTFFTTGNFQTMVNAQAIVLMLAIAATIPLRAGDFDLSIAALMTTSAAITAKIVTGGGGVVVALIAVLAVGVIIGLIHGFLVVKIGVDAFITTLGSLTALTGAAYAVTDSQIMSGFPQGLLDISRTEFLGLPSLTWIGWILVGVAWYFYERTPVGRHLVFIGGSRDAARLAGVRVDATRVGAFVASAMISAFAGFLFAGSLGSVDPSVSGQFLLQPFAAAFLGATTIAVGRFNAVGTLVGLYLLVVGITGLQLLGAQPWVSDVFNGIALVLAVTFARIAARSRGRAT
jgi:ribose transport system permease protein